MNPEEFIPPVSEAEQVVKLAVNIGREIWNFLDAASEKPAPTEYLSNRAIRAVQGTDKEDKQ